MNETVSVNNRIFLRLALAYLFCNMNFHIGPINLLPEFVGCFPKGWTFPKNDV